ncbi:MFS transporter [Rhodobacter sp. CZR27]|uniref:MFS transporter n=1 Tax=Rhodobacter sp. CZR27 TaxID=2033869 RepID=UPI000BBF0D14|nr:MFS transporter [Rhodobacter sp. CZR27]
MRASPMLQVVVLWLAGLGAAAQFSKVGVIFEHIARVYPAAGEVALGLVVSIVGFAGLLFGTTAGLLVQRLGYRRVLVTAMAAGTILSCLQALLPPLPVMLALRAIEGVAHLAIVVAAPVMIAQTAPAARQGLAMTLWSSFFAVSFAFTAWIGRPLVAAFGIPPLFLIHALYMAGCALLLRALLPADTPERPSRLALGTLVRQHGEIYASARVAAPAIGFFCYTLVYVALLTLLPPMTDHAGLLASAMPLTSIAVSMTLGVWLLGRVTAVSMVQGGFAGAIVAMLLLWTVWGHQPAMLAAALLLAGALGLVQGASFAAIPQLNPDREGRTRAAGAVAQLGNLGTTSGTPLLAALLAAQGLPGLVLFIILPAAAGIGLHQWLSARRRANA